MLEVGTVSPVPYIDRRHWDNYKYCLPHCERCSGFTSETCAFCSRANSGTDETSVLPGQRMPAKA